ncbi:DUF4232 domain-containing protein [Streptacidiphilus sp. P02-A3a]|uniref:DUF4232 domain-containing protein n=1 Tax=Streptacidiphilus sp. P02-A3a TaxID=2704468 RepID=UPI0015FA79C6|nr:DUF4232 domain-containing protein [Streptacidiphilus sp. P02-A3a]QMU67486.1 DUF4232 domain-containing protein [Streptacidiphilus sp. P02-A3a]
MRVQRVAIAATAALLGSLALSACGGGTGSVAAGGQVSVAASGAASGPSASGPASGPASGSTGSTGSSGSGGAGASGGSSPAPGTAAPVASTGGSGTGGSTGGSPAAARCTTAHLGFAIGPDSGPQAVGDTSAAEVVKLTNNGGSSCVMHGFPGVDLKTNYGTVAVARAEQTPRTITVAPGASALFSIDYPVNNTGGSGVRVDSMVITPPNETHSYTLAWNQGTLPATDGSGPSLDVTPVVLMAD